MSDDTITVCVKDIFKEAKDILRIELVRHNGSRLPQFNAGAHIDIFLPDGLIRQYSVCSNPKNKESYQIAVLKEVSGRGGSRVIHETFHVGMQIEISPPRNHFPLSMHAKKHLLLAGGIGVTPMIAMIYELEEKGAHYLMHYCTRSPDNTAFYDFLQLREIEEKVFFHHDQGNPENGLDIKTLLSTNEPGTHVYFCGPASFMNAVEGASADWPIETLHFEYFSKSEDSEFEEKNNKEFFVKIAKTGDVFEVKKNQTIVEVLRNNGLSIDTSCEDGFCGTCITKYVEGEPEHRDNVLDDEDRKNFVLICCARSKTPYLVLDL